MFVFTSEPDVTCPAQKLFALISLVSPETSDPNNNLAIQSVYPWVQILALSLQTRRDISGRTSAGPTRSCLGSTLANYVWFLFDLITFRSFSFWMSLLKPCFCCACLVADELDDCKLSQHPGAESKHRNRLLEIMQSMAVFREIFPSKVTFCQKHPGLFGGSSIYNQKWALNIQPSHSRTLKQELRRFVLQDAVTYLEATTSTGTDFEAYFQLSWLRWQFSAGDVVQCSPKRWSRR